jgi:hypothetical protein
VKGPIGDPHPYAPSIVGATAAVLAVAGLVSSVSGAPIVRPPLPLATTLPVLGFWVAVGEDPNLRWVVEYAIPMLAGPLFLLAWHPRLAVGADYVPRRSLVGLLLLSVLAAAHFANGWSYGMRYQGSSYVIALLCLNLAVLTASWAALCHARRRRTFSAALTTHALVVAWLVSIAFPWLGDLP